MFQMPTFPLSCPMQKVITSARTLTPFTQRRTAAGYVDFTIDNIAQADYFVQAYVIDGSYETAYYYTSVDGHEFLIEMDNGHVWAQCCTSHANVSLHGAYLTTDEVEDILDNLSLAINE